MVILTVIILCLILILAYIIDFHHASDCEKAGFWSDRSNPDKVLKASFVAYSTGALPPNRIINKGYNSSYWDCFELQKSLGTPNNEILENCRKFV